MLIFHPAAEGQHQRSACFDPCMESCRYIVAQDKQARCDEDSIWFPGQVLGNEVYCDIAPPQSPVVATNLVVIGERPSRWLHLECPEHIVGAQNGYLSRESCARKLIQAA